MSCDIYLSIFPKLAIIIKASYNSVVKNGPLSIGKCCSEFSRVCWVSILQMISWLFLLLIYIWWHTAVSGWTDQYLQKCRGRPNNGVGDDARVFCRQAGEWRTLTLQLINPSSQTFLAGITIAREELVPKAHPGHDAKKVKTKAKTEREHHDCPITSGFLMRLRRKEYEVRPLTLSNVDRILLETRRFFILLPRQFPGTLFYTLLIINTRIINSLVVQSFGSTGSLVVNTYKVSGHMVQAGQFVHNVPSTKVLFFTGWRWMFRHRKTRTHALSVRSRVHRRFFHLSICASWMNWKHLNRFLRPGYALMILDIYLNGFGELGTLARDTFLLIR